MFGGFGKDASTGGAGNDIFMFTATSQSTVGANADVITDFDDFGNDRIDLNRRAGSYRRSEYRRIAGRGYANQADPHKAILNDRD